MAQDALAPGMSAARLDEARRALEAALGSDKVFFDALDQRSYRDKFAVDDAGHHPAGAVAPDTVEEIQAVLRIANQYRLPLFPIARGKNLGYGGSAPVLAGSRGAGPVPHEGHRIRCRARHRAARTRRGVLRSLRLHPAQQPALLASALPATPGAR